MSTDFRALCAELHVAVQLYTGQNPAAAETPANELVARLMAALAATTTALAQSEPEGVGDEELLRTYGKAKRDHCYEGPMDDWPKRAERAATVHGLRAAIAADRARFGRPAIEPEERWYPSFADWLEREMPEGTVIGDPLWWASKIATYLQRYVPVA